MFRLDTFYKSKEWDTLRHRLMIERTGADGNIVCEYCGQPIVRRYDCIAHHKVELTDENVNDFSISLNPDNIQLIHFRCHNQIHERFDGFRQKVYLVYGAPCSGKTTWVRNVAFDDDLILDLDSIWEAVCKADRLHKPNRLKANVFGVRDCLIDMIRTRTGKWRNAYIIGTYALRSDRDRICNLLDATPIYIESTYDECISRAPDENWKDFICEWFETFSE